MPYLGFLVLSLATSSVAQTNIQLQALNDHFLGTWVGANHDYSRTPTITSNVSITVTKDRKEGRLDMGYSYVEEGKPTAHAL